LEHTGTRNDYPAIFKARARWAI